MGKKMKSNPSRIRIPTRNRITSPHRIGIPYGAKFTCWIKLGSQVQIGEELQVHMGEEKSKWRHLEDLNQVCFGFPS